MSSPAKIVSSTTAGTDTDVELGAIVQLLEERSPS
jgi:hypothetical protein